MYEPPQMLDDDWETILGGINNHKVVPIVGPQLVTVNGLDGTKQPLVNTLCLPLAKSLGLVPDPGRHTSLNRVAFEYVLNRNPRWEIYRQIKKLLRALKDPPSPALCDLASITDFSLFITTTFDPLFERALEQVRPGYSARRPDTPAPFSNAPFPQFERKRPPNVWEYHYNTPVDLPDSSPDPILYYLFGSSEYDPDFAVWDEDYIEYICKLMEHHAQLKNLRRILENSCLLFLGAPFDDWVVRFFLRVAKNARFTDLKAVRGVRDLCVDQLANLGEPMVFFFDKVVGTIRIIPGDPSAFVTELARRWHEKYGPKTEGDPLEQLADEFPPGAVFISYSREDLEAARLMVSILRAYNVPVWLDKERLRPGDPFAEKIQVAVAGCSFFLSLISTATESNARRFVHKERGWAARRHVRGFRFYIPVIIDDTAMPSQEPAVFRRGIHYERHPGGRVTDQFATWLSNLVRENKISGRPRV